MFAAIEGVAMRCWEVPGCKGSMAAECPHDATGICPRICMNTTFCSFPWFEQARGMEVFDAYDVDFGVARVETCHSCRFFLTHAPRIVLSKPRS